MNFKLSELCITADPIHLDVADKLLQFHIAVMQPIRERLNCSIWASEKSGYRPVAWEKMQGRNGSSEHTFKGKGAVDWTCSKPGALGLELLQSPYIRLAWYPLRGFYHCDYRGVTRSTFICLDGKTWNPVQQHQFEQEILRGV